MANEAKKPNIFKAFLEKTKAACQRVGKFFREIKSEINKITWPAVPTVFRNTGIVLLVMLVVGVFVFALDFGLNQLLGLIMSVAPIT